MFTSVVTSTSDSNAAHGVIGFSPARYEVSSHISIPYDDTEVPAAAVTRKEMQAGSSRDDETSAADDLGETDAFEIHGKPYESIEFSTHGGGAASARGKGVAFAPAGGRDRSAFGRARAPPVRPCWEVGQR